MTRLRQYAGWMCLFALSALAVLGMTDDMHERPVHDEATDAAIAKLLTSFAPGDAVIVKPLWDDGLHERLARELKASSTDPDVLFGGEYIDPISLLRFKRVWVLSRFDVGSALPSPGAKFARASESNELGHGVELGLYTVPESGHANQLTDDLASLTVARRLKGGKLKKCPWRDGQFRCGLRPWLNVRPERRDVFHRDVDWLFAHAGPDDAVLTLTWKEVTRPAHLVVRAGFTQSSVRNEGGSPTTVRTFVDGVLQDEFVLQPTVYSLMTRPIVPPAGRGTMDVTFEIVSADASWRQVMLQADLFSVSLDSLD